ncbi:hypothetical protein [Nocardia aurea]|uniref:Uncharacterized protein n=1 Tax=Nocardia aurea TaxID=2144174 RepID=A0ABV3G215_9NOCA
MSDVCAIRGVTSIPHAVALADWAIEHHPDIAARRAEYDEREH